MSIKNKHWFPHPANLRSDRRMKRAMKDLPGGVGYAAIVLTIEVLRCEPDFKYPFDDLDLLATEFDISLSILQTVISSYGFFETIQDEHGKMFFSPLLSELMNPYVQKKQQNQVAGKMSAEKRRKSQEEQLRLLSQLDSSQHVFSICDATVEQNRKEKNRIEKRISLFSNFKEFKRFILDAYKNKIVCYGACDFLETTAIIVTNQGYLRNEATKKDLSKEDALKVWNWMFTNQDKLHEASYISNKQAT